jgi:hypothetical protein
MNLNRLLVPFVPAETIAEAGTQTLRRENASRVEDARERVYGPLGPRFRGDVRRWVQWRCKSKFIAA